jgi:hypothetical protein
VSGPKKPPNPRWKWECEEPHDFLLFMVNTGLRPDEVVRLESHDAKIVEDKATDETIPRISVRGKRGVGYCKSMPGAVMPFERVRDRKRPDRVDQDKLAEPSATDLIFPTTHRELFNAVLDEQGLKTDREGLRRSAYSSRHT